MPRSALWGRYRRLLSVGIAIILSVTLVATVPLFVTVGSASESFSVGTASDAEIGQASTTHDVSFDVDLADGETTYVEIDTSNLPAGASLVAIQGATSDNADVDASAVGVNGGVANVSASDTGLLINPDPATITVTLELDTSGLDAESTGVQYDVDEVDVGANPDGSVAFDLVDTIAPTYDAAVTGDLPGGDSTANDTVTLNVTEEGTGIDASTVAASDFAVDGVAPSGAEVATVDGQPVIRLTVGAPLATDASPTVELTGSLDDEAGNTLSGTVSRTATDGLVPVISNASYEDADGDGRVDRVNVTYSEAITGSYVDGDWTIPTAGSVSLAKDGTGSFSSPTVVLDVTGAADATGGATAPEVRYDGSTIEDVSGNSNAAGAETTTVADAAAPVNVSVGTTDADGDGQIDRIDVSYSEDVSVSSPEAEDYALGGGDAGSVSVTGAGVAGSVVQITVDAPAGSTSLDLTLDYDAAAGAADSVTDGTNAAPSFTGAQVADTTPPSIVAATVLDLDGDGAVDAVNVTFTEAIDDSSVTPTDYGIGGTETDSVETLGTGDDETIRLRITTDVDEVDGTDAKDLTYSPGTTTDVVGNALASVAAADVGETDGADPIVSNFSLDADGGGTVTATFDATESLSSATVDVDGPETGSITSFTVSGSTHEGSLTVGENGQYTGTLTAAADAAGNPATTGQSDSATVDAFGSPGGSSSPRLLDDVSSRTTVTTSVGLIEVGVRFEGGRASTFDVDLSCRPVAPPPGTFVTCLDISLSEDYHDVAATVKFAISRDRVETLDADPEALTVYRYNDGAWQALQTSVDVGFRWVRVEAETPGFSRFAIVAGERTERSDAGGVTERSPPPSEGAATPTPGPVADDADRTTPTETTRESAGGTDVDERTERDGLRDFSAVVAIVALLAVLRAAARRW